MEVLRHYTKLLFYQLGRLDRLGLLTNYMGLACIHAVDSDLEYIPKNSLDTVHFGSRIVFHSHIYFCIRLDFYVLLVCRIRIDIRYFLVRGFPVELVKYQFQLFKVD